MDRVYTCTSINPDERGYIAFFVYKFYSGINISVLTQNLTEFEIGKDYKITLEVKV